jgi:hypothetical protein
MDEQDLTVGAMAEPAGVSTCALHHHDRLGLLRPSRRAPICFRRYSTADMPRLHRIAVISLTSRAPRDRRLHPLHRRLRRCPPAACRLGLARPRPGVGDYVREAIVANHRRASSRAG